MSPRAREIIYHEREADEAKRFWFPPSRKLHGGIQVQQRAGPPALILNERAKMLYTDDEMKTGEWVRTISAQSSRGWHAFYHTIAWRKKRVAILRRDHYACVRCRAQGKYTRAATVHHVKHLRDCPELALTDSNLQSLCASCHEEMHPEYRFRPRGYSNEERW